MNRNNAKICRVVYLALRRYTYFTVFSPISGTQEGIQVRIMKRMIERVTGKDGAGGLVADRLGIDREDGDDVESSAQSPIPSMVYLPASMSMPFAPLVVQLVR